MNLASEMRALSDASNKLDERFNKYVEENKERIKAAAMEGKRYVTLNYYDRDDKMKLKDYFIRQGFQVKTAIELGWKLYGQDSCLTTYIVW